MRGHSISDIWSSLTIVKPALRVVSPVTAICNVSNYTRSTLLLALATLRTVLGQFSLAKILTDRASITENVQKSVGDSARDWGVLVILPIFQVQVI